MKNKLAPRFEINDKLLRFKCGGVVKFQHAGKFPGTQKQYDHVVGLYLSFVDKGINPQAALDLVNLKVWEGGWEVYKTGDGKKYKDADSLTDHIIEWHGRMYPESLKANSFELFYRGIMITPKYKYNPRGNAYKRELESVRPGVKKRINYYRSTQGLPPLAYVDQTSPDLNPITNESYT